MAGALVFAAATQEIPLDRLALVLRGTCIPGSYRTMAVREISFSRLRLPGYCTDSRLWHTSQSFCERCTFACPGASAWRTSFRFGTHLVDYGAALKKHRLWTPPCHSHSALLQLTRISKKEHIHLSGASIFVTATLGETTRSSGQWSYVCSPTGLHIFSYC